jgi:cysteinyl-tRNA synthetase
MSLFLTDTLTKEKREFVPLENNTVNIYSCGVTVYDLTHFGHARSFIVWDVLRRHLKWLGYAVKFVQNYTDIDDKIIAKANEQNQTIKEITEKYINEYEKDMTFLNVMLPDKMPRATDHLSEIRSMIKTLESKGAAYTLDGSVYFSVNTHENYGRLSGRILDNQKDNSGEFLKKNSFDFALWKASKPGEPSYSSYWGNGRPGWHIECSAMIWKEFGKTIDIHLGGSDLIFPHHENEIAQTEVATENQLSRWWLHSGMVMVDGKKMSKSLGNFTTIRSLQESGFSPMAIRLFVLQGHYRKPLDFTENALKMATNSWNKLNEVLLLKSSKETTEIDFDDKLRSYHNNFIDALNDDLNTSLAISVLFVLVKEIRVNNSDSYILLLCELSAILGLFGEQKSNISESEILEQIELRNSARKEKNFTLADEIREKLLTSGVKLEDTKDGTSFNFIV